MVKKGCRMDFESIKRSFDCISTHNFLKLQIKTLNPKIYENELRNRPQDSANKSKIVNLKS